MENLKDLGCMNGWSVRNPNWFIIYTCHGKGHVMKDKELGKCYHEYKCEICGFRFTKDSSD